MTPASPAAAREGQARDRGSTLPQGETRRLEAVSERRAHRRLRRATHLSVKALRHYHEMGLLAPADIDPTGYRRYALGQIPTAQVIRRLRDLDMPLDDIRGVLRAADLDGAQRADHPAPAPARAGAQPHPERRRVRCATCSNTPRLPPIEHRSVPLMRGGDQRAGRDGRPRPLVSAARSASSTRRCPPGRRAGGPTPGQFRGGAVQRRARPGDGLPAGGHALPRDRPGRGARAPAGRTGGHRAQRPA